LTRRLLPRIALILLGAAAAALLPAPSPAAADATADDLVWSVRPSDGAVGVSRPNFGYRADPGASVQDSLDVTNLGDAPLTLQVYAADAFTPQGGGIDLLQRDETSTDVGTWIALGVDSISIEPQQTVAVPFTLVVPADATPGDHAGGIVTSITTGSGPVAVERRLGSRVIVRVSGELTPRLELSDASIDYGDQLDPFAASTATVTYTVANTGNVRLDAHPTIAVGGPFGMLGRTAVTEDLGELLPGSSRSFRVEVPAVWAVLYLAATVTLEPFPSNPNDAAAGLDLAPISTSAAVLAVNWGQLILIVALIALVLGGLWWRRRRRRAVRAAIDAAVKDALADAPAAS